MNFSSVWLLFSLLQFHSLHTYMWHQRIVYNQKKRLEKEEDSLRRQDRLEEERRWRNRPTLGSELIDFLDISLWL